MSKVPKAVFVNIQNAIREQEQAVSVQGSWLAQYKTYIRYLNNDYSKSGYETKYYISSLYTYLNTIIPALFYQSPYITVSPTTPWFYDKKDRTIRYNGEQTASVMEALINREIKRIDLEEEVRQALQDAIIGGFGIVKVGYSANLQETPDARFPEKDGFIFAQRVRITDFFYDPQATSTTDANFLIQRFTLPLKTVKESELYSNTATLNETDYARNSIEEDKALKNLSKHTEKIAVLYEYHDYINNRIYTLIENQGPTKERTPYKVIRNVPIKTNFKVAFCLLKFTGDNDSFRGIPIFQTVEDQALAMNELFTLMVQHYQRFPGALQYEEGTLSESDVEAFLEGKQGAVLHTNPGALSSGRVKQTPPLQMGAEYFTGLKLFSNIAETTLGTQDFKRGVDTKRKTAYEVRAEVADSSIRQRYMLNFVRRFILEIVTKLAGLIQQTYDKAEAVRIEGKPVEWVIPKMEAIKAGSYLFDFNITSMLNNKTERAQGIINLFQTAAQLGDLAKEAFREVDFAKAMKIYVEGLNISWEEISKKNQYMRVSRDPYEENQEILEGKHIPDPDIGDDLEEHLAVHANLPNMIPENDPNREEILREGMRHWEMHLAIAKQKGELPAEPIPQGQPQGGPVQ